MLLNETTGNKHKTGFNFVSVTNDMATWFPNGLMQMCQGRTPREIFTGIKMDTYTLTCEMELIGKRNGTDVSLFVSKLPCDQMAQKHSLTDGRLEFLADVNHLSVKLGVYGQAGSSRVNCPEQPMTLVLGIYRVSLSFFNRQAKLASG